MISYLYGVLGNELIRLTLILVNILPNSSYLSYTHWFLNVQDVVGHMKLVNGQSMIGKPTIEVSEVATSRRMVVHIQPHE